MMKLCALWAALMEFIMTARSPEVGVFHAGGDIHGACSETVLLVFDRARADSFVGQKVIQIAAVFRVQHFVCACEAGLLNGAHVIFCGWR